MAGPNANLPNGQELVQLPLSNDVPWYTFQTTLAGTQYTFVLRFNTRMNRWLMDILDATASTTLIAGLPLLIERDIAGQYAYVTGIPQGTLFCTDDTGAGAQPTRLSFGLDHTGWYLDPTATT